MGWPKVGRTRRMSCAASASSDREKARQLIEGLVKRYRKDGIAKMDAYSHIGEALGRSERWVRKVLSREDTTQVWNHQFIRIAALYDRLCTSFEERAAKERALLHELRSEAHAATARSHVLVDGLPGTESIRASEGEE